MSKNEELKELTKPIVEWLKKNYHPHATVIIDCNHAEVLEGAAVCKFDDEEQKEKDMTKHEPMNANGCCIYNNSERDWDFVK